MANIHYDRFNKTIENMRILHIPIVSCVNRETGTYKLDCDGNVNRIVTTFSWCNSFKSLDVMMPSNYDSNNILTEFAEDERITVHYVNAFGLHAGDQRSNPLVVKSMLAALPNLDDFDFIIFESQYLGEALLDIVDNDKLIFYNPVSKTDTKTRNFLEGYDKINQTLVSKCFKTILCSNDQVKFFKSNKVYLLDTLIDRNLKYFDYDIDADLVATLNKVKQANQTIYFLPFRMTDAGYRFEDVLNIIKSDTSNCLVLYSDPNNSGLINSLDDELQNKFCQVSTSRNVYYTLLDHCKVTIPYLEDLDFINHAAIHEFLNDKSDCIVIVSDKLNNPYGVNEHRRVVTLEEYNERKYRS